MVSSTLEMELEELYATLERLRVEFGNHAEYVSLRSALPAEWPL
jgi:hypothetical protein